MQTLVKQLKSEHGTTLIETAIGSAIMATALAGLLSMGALASTLTENHGHLDARTAEYAQDKLEQLLTLSYGDDQTDTRTFPAGDDDGSGLAIGGSADPDNPVNLYVDYLDVDGSLLESEDGEEPDGWFYKRVWQVAYPFSSTTLKQITVTATVKSGVGPLGKVPEATVSAFKSYPF